jgi:phage shock protein A
MAAGFLKRVRRLTMAKINAFLDGAENPEQVFPQLVAEMREECKKAVEAEATAVAAHKRRVQERDDAQAEVDKWASRAELAVKDGDDGLARTAIENQVSAERRLDAQERALDQARSAMERAREAREDLHSKLETLERKRDEILTRARAAKSQEEVQKVLAGLESDGGASILDAVARMEEKVAAAEARAGAYGDVAADMAGGSDETKFRKLERKQAIDERLAELKQKVAGEGGPAADTPEEGQE